MTPELQGMSIVLVGSFNPAIFQPAWFAAQGLIRELEAEEANTEIIHKDITIFNLEWLRLEVTRDRFNAITEQEAYFDVLIDLVHGSFSLLKHTPAGVLGINTNLHYRVKSVESLHSLGHRLAPKEPWKDTMKKPGMLRLDMQDYREDGPKGYRRVRIEPSTKCSPGIYVNVNDHYQVEDLKNVLSCEEIIQMLVDNWQESIETAKNIATSLI